MFTIKATCKINPLEPLPQELEGKEVSVIIQAVEKHPKKRRQRGSAKGKIWLAPDFDEPLANF